MKTFTNPKELNSKIGEFTYEGCRYSGIEAGLSFSVLSEGLAEFLVTTYPFLVEKENAQINLPNEYCCSKCGKDCGSKYMKERHEKVCTAEPQNLCIILKPSYIFWNYKNLDKTQLTEEQFVPTDITIPNNPSVVHDTEINEESITNPAPGAKKRDMIGTRMEDVTVDRDGVSWYGDGLTDDVVR
jgi:hypothetical protein